MLDPASITLAILAGGEGRRMGKPKADLTIGGLPILQYLLRQFAWTGPTLLVTAPMRQHPPACELFEREAIDPIALGPLGGLRTALQNCSTDYLIATTVDMPNLRVAHFQWLWDQLHPNRSGVTLRHLDNGAWRSEPFPFACMRGLLPAVESQLAGGNHSMLGLTALPAIAVLDAPLDWPAEIWTNLNTPAAYKSYLAAELKP